MKKTYRIMAFTLSLAVVLGSVDLKVFATDTEATYSVNETEEVVDETEISEIQEIEDEGNEMLETSEVVEEKTETVLTDEIQVTEAETTNENTTNSNEPEESNVINEEKTETVLTDEIQVTEAETLNENIETTILTVSGNDIQIEEETETILTVGVQDIEAETLEEEIVKFNVTFVDSEGNEVLALEISDISEIELPEAPEKEGYSFIKWDIDLENLELTEDLIIRPIYEEIEEKEEVVLTEKTIQKAVDGKLISIQGIMPENAEIVVEKVRYTTNIQNDIEELFDENATVVVYEAFDIKIKVDNTEYQPNEFDESVVVSIKNIKVENKENEELKVFHIDNSNNIEEVESNIDTSNNVAEFVAESFSVYVIGGVTYNTDSATLLENNYGTAYLYDDGTLVVTEFKKAGYNGTYYPWYSKKDDIKSVKIVDGIEEIIDYAFSDLSNLETIDWNDIKVIGSRAFRNCSSLSDLTISSQISTIKDYAFENCGLINLVFEENQSEQLNTIGWNAFISCNNLSKVVINGNYSLGNNLGGFASCNSLEELE